jgi:hypothetical protein
MAAGAIAFLLLGAMTVWISVLSLALKAVLLAGVGFVMFIVYCNYKRRKQQ